MKYLMTLCFLTAYCFLTAQTTVGLIAYYKLDTSLVDHTGNSANTGVMEGNPGYSCGVDGNALAFDGFDDRFSIIGGSNVNSEFDTEDFTVSFYFKPIGSDGTQYLLSKRSTNCDDAKIFYIRYAPLTRTINVFLSENASKSISMIEKIDNEACWQLLTLVRQNTRVKLYINGQFAQELGTVTRIDLLNNGNLTVGGGECLATNERNFNGLIDDLRIYNRALNELEISRLYFSPDRILNRDTLLFLGNSVDIRLSQTCANSFSWMPGADVMSPFEPEPRITPSSAGIFYYTVEMTGNISTCIASDSIRINVVDPNELDCETIFLPKAFTPNGDGLNDTYGISNPFAIPELFSFEIFDRWGSRVFYTEDPFARWDGTFQGEDMNPGVLLYKVRYQCAGLEKLSAGSLTLLR